MAEIIASSTTTGTSADFTLTDGQSTTIFLKDADSPKPPVDAIAVVQIKSGTQYFDVGALDAQRPVRVLQAPGTFRVFKYGGASAFGVDRE